MIMNLQLLWLLWERKLGLIKIMDFRVQLNHMKTLKPKKWNNVQIVKNVVIIQPEKFVKKRKNPINNIMGEVLFH